MTRGNQREIDRARAAARHAGKGESKEGDPKKRAENDAKALQEKIARKKAAEEAGGGVSSSADAKGGSGGGGGGGAKKK